MYIILLTFFHLFAQINANHNDTTTPIILWHGMGDSCCNPFSMGRIKAIIETKIPGVFVDSVEIGNGIIADIENGFLKNVNDQVKIVCDRIAKNERFKNGFHGVGFSQGGQFMRAVAQRCPNPPMKNLISIGGQHQGVNSIPDCPAKAVESRLCEYIRRALDFVAYESYIQNHLVQAQYWHDPLHEDDYREKSSFLADINNERVINESYIKNMNALNNFVMVKFLRDSVVVPRESEWFGFYTAGQDSLVVPLQQMVIYKDDRLGLKKMDEAGKLKFLAYDSDHLAFDEKWFEEEIIQKYLV